VARLRAPYTVVLTVGAIAVALALAIEQGLEQRVGHDFHVFWQAGRNFARGDALYHGFLPGARVFKYPPFAAFVFQPLGVFPLPVAAVLFSLLNLALWVAAAVLTRDIVALTSGGRASTPVPLVLAVLLSAQFFLDNFHHVQMNEVILVLVLLGLRAHLREQDLAASAYIVTATAIKLVPVFFIAWLLMRGRRRAALAVPLLVAACVLVPLLVRGPATGAAELVEYYQSFLAGHQHGEVGSYTRGHNLASFVNRTMLRRESGEDVRRPILALSEGKAQHIYRGLWATVLLAFLAMLAVLRYRRAPVSAFEFSVVFLTCLLLSPITFTANLVFLLFVFCAFLSVRFATLSFPERIVAVLLGVAIAATGLSGKDLVGRTANLYIRDYGIFVLTMLLLFGAGIALAVRKSRGRRACATSSSSRRGTDTNGGCGA
jgi:hypothetical protein